MSGAVSESREPQIPLAIPVVNESLPGSPPPHVHSVVVVVDVAVVVVVVEPTTVVVLVVVVVVLVEVLVVGGSTVSVKLPCAPLKPSTTMKYGCSATTNR